MTRLIHTNQQSKLSKKQREKRDALLKEQRRIQQSFTRDKRGSLLTQSTAVSRRETRHIPSLDTGIGNASAAPAKVYTGDKVVGISTLHKSNAVPVFSQEEAIDIAKMRR